MTAWLEDRLEEIRHGLTPSDEGALWMMLFDDPYGAPVIVSVVEDAMAQLEPQLTSNIALILAEVPAKAVLLVVPRRSGRPQDVDRQLWVDLSRLVGSSIELIDLVVVGEAESWCARGG
jgi:hypothetical protein